MLVAAGRVGGIVGQRAAAGHDADAAIGRATERDEALGKQVRRILALLRDLVEELVQGLEVGASDVPMSLLGVPLQIEGMDQPRSQQNGRLAALGGIERVLRSMHVGLQKNEGGGLAALWCVSLRARRTWSWRR